MFFCKLFVRSCEYQDSAGLSARVSALIGYIEVSTRFHTFMNNILYSPSTVVAITNVASRTYDVEVAHGQAPLHPAARAAPAGTNRSFVAR